MRGYKEKTVRDFLFITAIFAVFVIIFILVFLFKESLPIFQEIGLKEFIFGMKWDPTGKNPSFGIYPLIIGTILVTLGAMIFAVPLGIACALYISQLASPRVKMIVKPAVELLAGIPSVVYGFYGLIILSEVIRVVFDTATGTSWLAGSIILGVMALPTIVSVAEDALSAVQRHYKQGSLALGATKWQTISLVTFPSAISGITAAVILGMGRAIGETMAVMMVTGNAAIIPEPITNVFSPVRTITGSLGIEMGEVAADSMHYYALFGLATVLLVITLLVNLSSVVILSHLNPSKTGRRSKTDKLMDTILGKTRITALVLIIIFSTMALGIMKAVLLVIFLMILKTIHSKINPRVMELIAFTGLRISVIIVGFILFVIIYNIVANGIGALSWEFLTQPPRNLGRSGGIFPAIVGTIYLVLGAIAIALPIGIGAAIYLTEYTRENVVTKIIRTGADLLNSTPSIVFGLFGFAFLVLYLDLGVSLITGQITLALMILPTIIRTTEEALKSVPDAVRRGSLALGASKWQTIRKVVLPPAIPGIVTGAILGIGRAAGETAPIMFTAVVFSQRHLTTSIMKPVMALPYHLFILSTNVPGADENKYGTALVLLMFVVSIYMVAIIIRNHYTHKIRW